MTDKVRAGRAIASFLIPPVGIITWAMTKDQFPKKAKGYLYLGIAGLALGAIGFTRYAILKSMEKKESEKKSTPPTTSTAASGISGRPNPYIAPPRMASPEQLAMMSAR